MIRILVVLNENTLLTLSGEIIFRKTDVSIPPGGTVKAFAENGGLSLPFIGERTGWLLCSENCFAHLKELEALRDHVYPDKWLAHTSLTSRGAHIKDTMLYYSQLQVKLYWKEVS